jgi:predicted ATPase
MIKRFRIVNFKSLADVTVDLGPVTVLVGRSGTGKSNFVDAIRFLRDFLLTPNNQPVTLQGGWARIVCATAPPPRPNAPTRLSFEVTFAVPRIPGDFQYRLEFEARQAVPQLQFSAESLSLGGAILFHQRDQKWIDEPKVLPAVQAGLAAIGRINGIQEVSLAYLALTSGIGCYDFPGAVLEGPLLGHAAWRPGQAPGGDPRGLLDGAENYLQEFAAVVDNLHDSSRRNEIYSALRLLNPSVRSVELEVPSRSRIVVGHGIGTRTLTLDIGQQSEGFRRLLAHLIALYQSRPKLLLIFEEPEKGIFPGALSVLADEFNACPDAGRGQIIMTTHSPGLLDHFEPQQIRVVDLDGLETRIGPVAPEQVESVKERLLSPGELLTVDLARIAEPANSAE